MRASGKLAQRRAIAMEMGPTPETLARARPPFWAAWSAARLESLQELYLGFTLRARALLARTFAPRAARGAETADFSPGDIAIYRRFVDWQGEMRAAGRQGEIAGIAGVLLQDEPCRDVPAFAGAVDLHVAILARARRLR